MNLYQSIIPDKNGYIEYSGEDQVTWNTLFHRQSIHIQKRACPEFIQGLDLIGFTGKEIPQHSFVTKNLSRFNGWGSNR